MKRTLLLCLSSLAVTISLCFGSAAEAAVCTSTLGPGSSFGGGTYAVTGSGWGIRFDRAFAFTPSVDCRLGNIELAFHLDSGTNGLRVSVVEDSSGEPGSTVVESTTVLDALTTDPGGSLVTALFSGANLLGAGSTYWIVVEAEPVTGNTSAVWHGNNILLGGARAVRTNGGSWQVTQGVLAAFQVNEGVLPVPALSLWGRGVLSATLLLLAGLSVGANRHGRDRDRGTPSRERGESGFPTQRRSSPPKVRARIRPAIGSLRLECLPGVRARLWAHLWPGRSREHPTPLASAAPTPLRVEASAPSPRRGSPRH